MKQRTSRRQAQRELVSAIVLLVLTVLGLFIAVAANVDRSAWGAAMLVGILGPIGGVTLLVLSSRLVANTDRRSVRVIALLAIVCAAIGAPLSLLALVG